MPGWKVCKNCHEKIKERLAGDEQTTEATTEEEESTEDEMTEEYNSSVFESTLHHADQRDVLNNTLEMIGISPLKTHALSKSSKVKDACEKVNRSYEKQKHMVKELFDLPGSSRLDVTEESIQKDMEEKARNFNRLMSLLPSERKNFRQSHTYTREDSNLDHGSTGLVPKRSCQIL